MFNDRLLTRLLAESAVLHKLPEIAATIALGYVNEVNAAIARIEALPSKLLSKDASDLELLVFLRAYVPSAYWVELFNSRPAMDCVHMLRLMEAAGCKPILRKAQELIKAELPLVERGLSLMAASTIDLSEHGGYGTDEAYLRGRLYGEACKSEHFDEPLIRRVIEFFR